MTKIQLRRDVAADWALENTVLDQGEPGIELPASFGSPSLMKVGDGATPWSLLPYVSTVSGGGMVDIEDLPAGSVIDVYQASDESWADRPTARTDVRINWVGYPNSVALPSGALDGRDSYIYRSLVT